MTGAARSLAVVVGFVLGTAFALTPSSAAASPARYLLEKCDPAIPGGGTEGAVFSGQPPFTGANNCDEPGGSMFVVQQGPAASGDAFWTLPIPAPPGGITESITVTGSMCNGAHSDAGTVAFAVQKGWSLNCTAETHSFPINSPSGSDVKVWLGCVGQCEGNPESWASGFVATEVDPVAPSVKGLGGTLLEGSVVHGHQTASANATDEGGGVAKMTLRVNGIAVEAPATFHCQTIQANNASVAGTVAVKVTPCPAAAQAGWTVDTGVYPFQQGRNSIAVCANDFATIGAPNEGCSTQSVKVDNSCAESPVGGGEGLTAYFKDSNRQRITVAYGSPAKVAGRLTNAEGQPLVGATVCLAQRTLDEVAPKLPIQTLVTDARGHYSYLLAPGPNRAVTLGYRRDDRLVERHLRYFAHAHPSLHASSKRLRNGQWVHFQGRLPGPHRRGNVVILQANVLGSRRWITFRRATSARKGIFRAAYRFSSTTQATTYRFRAVVPDQAGYPWVQGHSRPVRVQVSR